MNYRLEENSYRGQQQSPLKVSARELSNPDTGQVFQRAEPAARAIFPILVLALSRRRSYDRPYPSSRSSSADAGKHMVTRILFEQRTINNIRFSVKRIFWAGFPFYNDLDEERTYATFQQWIKRDTMTPKILWDDEATDTAVSLPMLLAPANDFKLEPFKDNRAPPKLSARARAADEAAAAAAAGAAPAPSPEKVYHRVW